MMTISIEWDKIANKLTEELCLEIALEDFVWDGGDLDIKGTVAKFKSSLEIVERLKKLIESSNKGEYISFSEVQKVLGEK